MHIKCISHKQNEKKKVLMTRSFSQLDDSGKVCGVSEVVSNYC